MPMIRVTALSGLGAKGPACFLLETGRVRLMLDLGYGPQPGLRPDVSGVGQVDALLLSHGHRDHAGALELAAGLGHPRLYATAGVLAGLGHTADGTALPVNGTVEIGGMTVRTGRNGHAPGGIWMHFGVADGVVYMGDYCVESPLYAFDPPPPAATVILDASYGTYSGSLGDCIAHFDPVLAGGSALFPVPVNGRGPEMARHVVHSRGVLPALGDDLRASLVRLAREDSTSLRPGIAEELAGIAREAPVIEGPRGLMFTGPGDGAGGSAAALIARWENDPQPDIVFSGYLAPGTPAERLTGSGRARFLRWNVHPRLADNVALARAVGAHTVVPAFGDARHLDAWREAFAPARVVVERAIPLSTE
jgi:glyoxylase-like metal-dependent hydrolase (beta-lactamase superfamily II)